MGIAGSRICRLYRRCLREQRAFDAGLDGGVVSNHSGRQVDGTLAVVRYAENSRKGISASSILRTGRLMPIFQGPHLGVCHVPQNPTVSTDAFQRTLNLHQGPWGGWGSGSCAMATIGRAYHGFQQALSSLRGQALRGFAVMSRSCPTFASLGKDRVAVADKPPQWYSFEIWAKRPQRSGRKLPTRRTACGSLYLRAPRGKRQRMPRKRRS